MTPRTRRAAILGAATVFLAACAPRGVDLTRDRTATIEAAPSKNVRFRRTRAHQSSETLLVSGQVHGTRRSAFPASGHVDVAVLAPDGAVLAETRTSGMHVPRRRPGRTSTGRRFAARLPVVPPVGSVIRLTFHSGRHPTAEAPPS